MEDAVDIKSLISIEEKRRKLIEKSDKLREKRNRISKEAMIELNNVVLGDFAKKGWSSMKVSQ